MTSLPVRTWKVGFEQQEGVYSLPTSYVKSCTHSPVNTSSFNHFRYGRIVTCQEYITFSTLVSCPDPTLSQVKYFSVKAYSAGSEVANLKLCTYQFGLMQLSFVCRPSSAGPSSRQGCDGPEVHCSVPHQCSRGEPHR